MRDEKIQCSFISEDGESLEISYREGMAKVALMDFPEDEESAENLLYPNEITGENSISDFMVKTANEGKDNESSFYRFQVKNSLQIPIAFFCGVKTENEGYQIIWKKGSGSNAYLYKTARNMALRHKSKRKCLFRLDELTDESDGQLLVEEVIRTEERNRILHFCMGEMNPDYREVLYLTYFEGMSYAQAAEVTGKTVKQITNMVYRGKESLRRLLEREGITNAES